jgi:hypothetical protein
MAECSRGRMGEGVFRLRRGRPWLGAGGEEEYLTGGERHAGVQEVSTTAKQSRPGVDEPEGEEELRGRRGCQGEPLRGRMRCRGMARLGVCRRSAEPRWRMKNTLKTWHARFGHINYDNLHLLKKNGVSGFPTIPRNLKQCDACILGKHRKQPFHDSTSRACRKLELIHSDLCGPMLFLLQMEINISCILLMITPGCVGCTCLKEKSQAFETFKNFHVWIQNEAQSCIGSLCTDNGREYTSNEFENLPSPTWDQTSNHSSIQSSTEWCS